MGSSQGEDSQPGAAWHGRCPPQPPASTVQTPNAHAPGCGVTLFPAAFPLRGADAALRMGQRGAIPDSGWERLSTVNHAGLSQRNVTERFTPAKLHP